MTHESIIIDDADLKLLSALQDNGALTNQQLAEAVRAENYELAAQIRDRIRGQARERNAAGPG